MKKTFLLSLLLFVACFAFAANVIPSQDARIVAKNFMSERCGPERFTLDDFELQYTETDANGEALYYRFQIGEKGFILISATDLISPVLAYSLESNFSNTETTDFMLDQYKESIKHIKANPSLAETTAKSDWKQYMAEDFKLSKTRQRATVIEPLVTTEWSQEKYYNQYCPYDAGGEARSDYRAPVGCVALTMINLLNYYRYPASGAGGSTYHHPKYGNLGALFSNFHYDYNAMTDKINSYEGEFAKLIYHNGLSVLMDYDSIASGAQSEVAAEAMTNHWRFSSSLVFIRRQGSEYQAYNLWSDSLLKKELRQYRPLYYSGNAEVAGGHAWIIDGFVEREGETYFHVNWGWGGLNNGFYKIDLLVGQGESFSNGEGVMINAIPANGIEKPDTTFTRLIASKGSICDGAGNMQYANNSYRQWMVATPNANSYTFDFRKVKIQDPNDYVIIYNGPTAQSGENTRITGSYLMPGASDYSGSTGSYQIDFEGTALPGAVTVNADSVLVVFISDNNITDYGFNINYTAGFPVGKTCNTVAGSIREQQGTITDRNTDVVSETYSPNNFCQWNIRIDYVEGIYFNFSKFDIKAGDFVEIADITNPQRPELLHRFDIYNLPSGTAFEVPTGYISLKFGTDNLLEGEGFVFHYYSKYGIPQNIGETGISNVKVFPNPASNNLNVTLTTQKAENLQFQITDLTGKVMATEVVDHMGGDLTYRTPVGHFAKGMYLLNIMSSTGKATSKFIVE